MGPQTRSAGVPAHEQPLSPSLCGTVGWHYPPGSTPPGSASSAGRGRAGLHTRTCEHTHVHTHPHTQVHTHAQACTYPHAHSYTHPSMRPTGGAAGGMRSELPGDPPWCPDPVSSIHGNGSAGVRGQGPPRHSENHSQPLSPRAPWVDKGGQRREQQPGCTWGGWVSHPLACQPSAVTPSGPLCQQPQCSMRGPDECPTRAVPRQGSRHFSFMTKETEAWWGCGASLGTPQTPAAPLVSLLRSLSILRPALQDESPRGPSGTRGEEWRDGGEQDRDPELGGRPERRAPTSTHRLAEVVWQVGPLRVV